MVNVIKNIYTKYAHTINKIQIEEKKDEQRILLWTQHFTSKKGVHRITVHIVF